MEQKPSKPYKQSKQKQKAKISDYMYLETQAFWQANQRMPSTGLELQAVAQKVYNHIASFRVAYEEVYAVYLKKLPHIIERLGTDGLPGHIRSHEEIQELQRIRAAKKAGKPRKKRTRKAVEAEPLEQDDTDNTSILINAGHSCVTKIKGRMNRYEMVSGLFAHELGHVLYTDFLVKQTYMNYLSKFKWYPAPPDLKTSRDAANERDFWEYVKLEPRNLEFAMKIASYIANVLEDGYANATLLCPVR